MRAGFGGLLLKFGTFVVVMAILTSFLFLVFSQARTGATNRYTAIFNDASNLKPGDSVRVAGARVGTVSEVALGPNDVTVEFDADTTVGLTTKTVAAVRYLNLVGDRYLELSDAPGSMRLLPPGSIIPMERTSPALDLDLLLGGLKPVIQGLNAKDVNALTSSLLQVMQGQEGTLSSLLSNTSTFSAALADNGQVVEQLIDSLQDVLATLAKDGDKFSSTIDRLERFVSELNLQRDPIGSAIDALATGTASVADLLTQARPPLAATINELNRLAPNIDQEKDRLDTALQKAPENYRKLVRIGSYGNFVQFYLCGLTLRLNDPTGQVIVLPFIGQKTGRCA